jgi:hypothetical protein
MGGLLLTALLLVDPRAAQVDVSGGIAVEARGGRAPVTPLQEPEASFLAIVTPDVAMQVEARRGGTFTLGYSPRIQYRVPNRIDLNRPLFLHNIASTYDVSLSRRWLLDVDLGTAVGEIDYTGINIALGNNVAVPDIAVVNFVFGSGSFDFTWLAAPRHRLTFGPAFDIRAPFESSRELMGSAVFDSIPIQTAANFGIRYGFQATPVDAISVTTSPGIVDYDYETTFFAADSRVGWERQLGTDLAMRLTGGVFGAQLLRGPIDDLDFDGEPDASGSAVFPVGSASITGRLYSRASHWVDGDLGFEVVGFFDRVTSRVDPRGQLTAGITTTIPPRWAVAVQGSAYTSLTPSPRPLVGLVEIPETVIRAQTPVTITINDNSAFEFGTVFSVRGSHLAADDYDFTQFEAWFYVAYRIGAGTARGGEEVAGRGQGQIGTGTQGMGVLETTQAQ